MKRNLPLLLLAATIVLSMGTNAQVLLNDDFTGAAGTVLTAAGWNLSGTNTTNPLTIAAPGLTFAGHPGSGAGNALPMTNNGQDLYKSFAAVNSGSVYLSFLMNVSAALTGDYILALSPTSSQTNYYARFHIKSSGTGYSVGISKSNEVTGGALYGTNVYDFNTTYCIVVKYTFVAGDSLNDAISVFAFAGGTFLGTEPMTPEVKGYVNNTKNDASDLSFVTVRQGSSTAAPTLTIDAIRVATTWGAILTDVAEKESGLPIEFGLSQNYPNPFNPRTTIKYTLASQSDVQLAVHDLLGRQVATLVNAVQTAGSYTVQWNAAAMTSGVYYCRLQAGGRTEVRSMVLMK